MFWAAAASETPAGCDRRPRDGISIGCTGADGGGDEAMTWSVASPVAGLSPAAAPVVAISLPCIRVRAVRFADPATGSSDFHYLYRNTSSDAAVPGKDLKRWGKGSKITDPEWEFGRSAKLNYRACFTRDKPVAMRVKLAITPAPTSSISATLSVTPFLDGSTAYLKQTTTSFVYPAGAAEHWTTVNLNGKMSPQVGRFIFKIKWAITGAGIRFCGPRWSRLRVYSIYARPLDPDHDSSATGAHTAASAGTLTGTRKRLDHLMAVIGGSLRRHDANTTAQLVDLVWKLHLAVNDRNPPYFNASNNRKISKDYWGNGSKLPVTKQWLAWVRTRSKKRCEDSAGVTRDVSSGASCLSTERSVYSWWNDISCIGHVQLAKTMMAAIGLYGRRTWVYPHTKQFPPAAVATPVQQTATPSDADCYSKGSYDSSKWQIVKFKHLGVDYFATPKLMEPGRSWENFEACLISPTGKFLPGGYNTTSTNYPSSFRTNKGFGSAKELLKWWSGTSRSRWGRRFICWVSYHPNKNHVWDVDGNHYPLADYEDIRTNGKTLPPPDPP